MKLGIMQPYFLPYLGYYSLIKHTDKWIIFDPVQFIRHGWIERNRILKPGEGWQYIAVPLEKHERSTLIKDVKIKPGDWKEKIFRQIEHYKKSPFYTATVEVLREALNTDTDSITELNANVLKHTCAYLGIAFDYEIFSGMDLQIDTVNDAGEWALHISKAMKADTYINPPGGIEIFDKQKFDAAGINLQFLKLDLTPYSQRRKVFEAGLSILDVMMFNSPADIQLMLDNYQLI